MNPDNPAVIVKRSGEHAPFDPTKIQHAVYKCMAEGLGETPVASGLAAEAVTCVVTMHLRDYLEENPGELATVELVQDLVERALMQLGYHQAARAYILYREAHRKERMEAGVDPADPWLPIVRDLVGDCADRLPCVNKEAVVMDTLRSLFPGAGRTEMFKAAVLAARARIELDPEYDLLTARLFLQQIYEEAVGQSEHETYPVHYTYGRYFAAYIQQGIEIERLDPRLGEFDLGRLARELSGYRDYELKYFGLQTLYDRYFIHHEGRRIELPQFFWMRVAMGLALAERPEERTDWAIKFYHLMSCRLYCPSTPTLFNAGTQYPQLSSCFLTCVEDDLDHIFQSIQNNALLSKWSGGLGNAWSKVRATNAYIKGTNGKSQGTVPFLKVADSTAVAVNQGGKRLGAVAAYLGIWHLDFEQFLELRKNTGDDRRRTHDMHTAAWIPDLFMQRVEQDGEWTLFSPDEVPELTELYGTPFANYYAHCEEQARAGKLRQFKVVRAKELWRKLLTMLFETGHPWITFQDPCNVRSPQSHCGVVHSSNLCTEITLNTSRSEVAVCNLGSINLTAHLGFSEYEKPYLNTELLNRTVALAVRMLDNVIDINLYPIPEAKNSNLKHRPVGLGLMGWQDVLYVMGIPWGTNEAALAADRIMEAVSYRAILASSNLAVQRGAYPSFPGSKWSQGIMPCDTIELLNINRGGNLQMEDASHARLEWQWLRQRVMEQGMRNSNVVAIAPTATISNICGVGTSIEPTFANLFVKSTMSGEFTVVNDFLVRELKKRGLWDEEMLADLKWYDGSVQEIDRIPEDLRRLFRTAFEIDPADVIECASRRQKWIDQSQSTNLWLAEPSGKKLSDIYFLAWRKGLKTTYYLRTKGATQVEKSTLDINKRGVQPRWMKERSASADITVDRGSSESVQVCRLDDPTCEACQ